MLDVAAEKGIRSWIQVEKLSAEGCKKVVEAVKRGEARYRLVLDVQHGMLREEAIVNGWSSANGHLADGVD